MGVNLRGGPIVCLCMWVCEECELFVSAYAFVPIFVLSVHLHPGTLLCINTHRWFGYTYEYILFDVCVCEGVGAWACVLVLSGRL